MENPDQVYDIAIIGMAGRFPGADNLDRFWKNLSLGVESVTFFSDEELLKAGVEPELLSRPNYVKANATIAKADCFDAWFFGISPQEAELIDPQQRVFLECAWHALENAGYDPEQHPGRIGVCAGAGMNTYLLNNVYPMRQGSIGTIDAYQIMISSDKDFLATQVSYKLNLTGPSLAIQTACSTSLVAVHCACQSLINRECDMALAGGVSIRVPQVTGYTYEQGSIASPDGHCRPFDALAQGTVSGDGVGVIVLKRLADAQQDGDSILAIIKGSAINNDGARKIGYTAPSEEGQVEVIAEALAMANVNPETIAYVEAHGTGTALGDPVEIKALTRAFRADTEAKEFCAIGAVKSNIGHLNTAAGIAGLIKTVLALQHKQLPPTLHFKQSNSQIDFASSPFYVNTELKDWKTEQIPRRAGVSSFGIGGTNAHVVLEESPALPPTDPGQREHLVILSAKTEEALEKATVNLATHLHQYPQANLADVAYTLQVGRRPFAHRRILVCDDATDAATTLETLDPKRVLTTFEEPRRRPLFFMFPGQGAQYVNMGRGLYESEPSFRAMVDRCVALLVPHLGFDLLNVLYPDPGEETAARERLKQTAITQPALFVIEYALATLWQRWGLQPDAMIGHSIGEYVAACLAGVFGLEDALAVIAQRGQLIQQLPAGSMLGVSLGETEVQPFLDDQLSLAAINGPRLCTISGPDAAIDALQTKLETLEVTCRRLHTSHAFHSALMAPILDKFTTCVERIVLNPPDIPFVSNVTGTWIKPGQATDPQYWAQHLRQPVRFADGLQALLDKRDQVLLEVGPGRTLSTLARQQKAQTVFTSLRHPGDKQADRVLILTTLGQLWLSGLAIDWRGFYGQERRRRIPLPVYPFARERYWVEPALQSHEVAAQPQLLSKEADITDWFYVPVWKQALALRSGQLTGQKRRWLVFLDACELGSRLVAHLERAGQKVISVTAGEGFQQIEEGVYAINPRFRDDYDALLEELERLDSLPHAIVHLWNVTADDPAPAELESLEEILDTGFYSVLFLAQALGNRDLAFECQVTVVSNNVHELSGEDTLSPIKATLLGAVKVIPLEYPNVSCRCLDVILSEPGSKSQERLVEQLLTELSREVSAAERVIACRGNHRWVQTFEPVRLIEAPKKLSRLREKGVYLITGGMGGIGFTLAEYVAQSVQARLILVGRSAWPPRDEWTQWLDTHEEHDQVSIKLRQLQQLENLGAQVSLESADVAKPQQMQAVVARAKEQFGQINGVIHCAGVADYEGVIHRRTREAMESALLPKVKGTLVLEHVLRDSELDFFVLCSSISTVLPATAFGQVSYCAANDFLDAFAYHKTHKDGTFTVSINWGTWQEVGMSAKALKQWNRDHAVSHIPFELSAGLLPPEGVEAFRRILETPFPRIVVSPQDLGTMIEHYEEQGTAGLPAAAPLPSPAHARPRLKNAYVAPRNEIEQTITNIWQEMLGIEQVGIHDNFFELGGHSLLLTRLRNRMLETLQVDLSMRSLFENATVAEMTQLMADRAQVVTKEKPIAQRLQTAFPTDRLGILEQYLRQTIAQSLDLQPNQLSETGDLTTLDLNLAAQVELMWRFKQDLNLQYYPAEIVAHASISELARSILTELDRMANLPRLATRNPLNAYTLRDISPESSLPLPIKKNSSAVFLHSCPRAGSTLLRIMLAGHPKLFCPPELNLLPYNDMQEWQRHSGFRRGFRWPAQGLHAAFVELENLTPDEGWTLLDDLVAQNWSVQSVYTRLQELASPRLLVDKTPLYWRDPVVLDRTEVLFELPKHICLVRHPCAVIESVLRMRLDQQPILNLFEEDDVDPYIVAESIWTLSTRNLLEFFEQIEAERQLLLRFEDLVHAPTEMMAYLCRFLDISFDEAVLNPYDGKPERMLQGLGDPNIAQHTHIEPELGQVWKKIKLPRPLDESTQKLATRLRYELPKATESRVSKDLLSLVQARIDDAQLSENLDELTGEEMDR